ncbi:hydrogenase expression/formation protein HypC [Rhodoblastus acidophilus]|uniref:HypC/HybG/HupF family hydrogenase formation chaperone n=1 Tax=Rhodoblastus acidophilus TaxID=1074 RepID=UPI002225838C|nr:HypC/HybG/HupF family hydrogenase formation chaperone [Rhodoblastus acidophilus]MCW2285419.1 hydrogenase expression/formation protein HypC [Rhodoblastus acidophilus]MCW2334332.1 hydrogenase expression/formation protein HypC [Rhodoblastus acidophilus]
MCIALPMKIVDVVDEGARTVRLVADARIARDRGGEQIVSAALLAESPDALRGLVGCWGVAHGGFLLSRLDEADALSRLDIFVAMDAQVGGF